MTPGRRRLLLLLALVAAAVVAFLVLRGEDDAKREVTRAQLAAEANSVCADLERKNRALEPPFRPYDTLSEGYFSAFLDNVQAAHETLEQLEPPPAEAEAYDALVAGYREIVLRLQETQGAVSTDQDPEAGALVAEVQSITRDLAPPERALGVCPGDTSARIAIGELLRRTVPNPLEETGELGG